MAVFPDRIVLKNTTDDQATLVSAIESGGTDEIQQGELVVQRGDGSASLYTVDANGDIVSISGGGGGTLPQYIDGYLDEDSSSGATSQALNVPTHIDGDLLVAAIMWRSGGLPLTAPAGWTFYGEYLTGITGGLGGAYQGIQLYTKVASSEPASYTWTGGAERNAGVMFAINSGGIANVTETVKAPTGTNPFNVTVSDRYLNLVVHTWVYASSTAETATLSGASVTQLGFLGTIERRMSAGYTSSSGTVSCTHSSSDGAASSNGAIVIQLEPKLDVALADLTDTDTLTTPPEDGQALVWDNASSLWKPGNVAASAGRGDGGDLDTETVDAAFVFGVYGGGDLDTITADDPIEFTGGADGGDIT